MKLVDQSSSVQLPTRVAWIVRGLFALAVGACSALTESQTPEQRAKEFISNVYTGKPMKPEDWLSREARSAPKFTAFGGLERMVQQSTARAEQFGGLKAIEVREAKVEGERALVEAEVRFVKDHRSPDNNAVAANEDIVWDLWFVREDGAWKVAP